MSQKFTVDINELDKRANCTVAKFAVDTKTDGLVSCEGEQEPTRIYRLIKRVGGKYK